MMAAMSTKPAILLTGPPGIGKSTVIRKIVALTSSRLQGFYTREVRAAGRRTGFEIVTLRGETGLLATTGPDANFAKQVLVGAYRVNIDAIEQIAIPSMLQALEDHKIVLVDEIGPMEIFSARFCDTVLQMLDDPSVPLVGTIVERPYRFADAVKAHPRVAIRQVTMHNREKLPEEICSILADA